MHTKSAEYNVSYFSPLSLLEEILFRLDWDYTYTSDFDLVAEVEGKWCTYHLCAGWKEETECLLLSTFIDIKIPSNKRRFIETLLMSMNPRLWLGHFEIMPEENCVAFRYTLTLRGNPSATLEQMEDIITMASTECDRLYPALQFVLWGGKSPEEALMAAMMDPHGEA